MGLGVVILVETVALHLGDPDGFVAELGTP